MLDCPVCEVPFETWEEFVGHVRRAHEDKMMSHEYACGDKVATQEERR